jgi:flagellum-specific peptidoglycan hydrolase FlgJ
MMDHEHIEYIKHLAEQADAANHPFPVMAACEGALESAYGKSYLAVHGLNLFGMKQHKVAVGETLTLPTREVVDGKWTMVDAHFVKYPDLAACFADRLATLKRLANDSDFLRYKIALAAKTAEEFLKNLSLKWSSDPNRGVKVMEIYGQYQAAVKS